jgi:hypothetical protein
MQLKEDSKLPIFSINAGKWTISAPPLPGQKEEQYISFHYLTTDRGFIRVFSLNPKDTRVINHVNLQKSDEESKEEND